mmetsp:Transcript_19528/g.45423  ORF Transcript_19528/g.45423 Transcript_19528/m.45423 type:complete len:249 (-) Transcript_19528:54-800(-)
MFIMHVLQSQRGFGQPPQNLAFHKVLARILGPLDALVQITTLRIVHDDMKVPVLCEALSVADDVWMLQRCQNSDLVDCILPLLLVHSAHVDNLHDILMCLAVLHKHSPAITALSNFSDLKITMSQHIGSWWRKSGGDSSVDRGHHSRVPTRNLDCEHVGERMRMSSVGSLQRLSLRSSLALETYQSKGLVKAELHHCLNLTPGVCHTYKIRRCCLRRLRADVCGRLPAHSDLPRKRHGGSHAALMAAI